MTVLAERKRKAVYNPEADRRWSENNPDHKRYLVDRTSARRFIRSKATLDDLDELETMIAVRRDEIAGKSARQDCARIEQGDGVEQ